MKKKTEPMADVEKSSWTIEEARASLEELLLAATKDPQEIRFGQRRYRVLVLPPEDTADGHNLLRRGGPLEEDDVLD